MFEWDDFRFFQAVKRTGTLKAAAATLKTDQATVGRRLYALEEKLGTKLFEKRSTGYFLTAAGERISGSIDRIESEFDGVVRAISGDEARLEGTVRIAAPGALANHFLIPHLKSLTVKNPGVTLEFLTGPDVVNLAKREADIAIRLVKPKQRNLQLKKIGTMSLGLYAAKSLWKGKKAPATLEDLARYPFAGLVDEAMSELEADLLARLGSGLNYALKTHAWTAVHSAVEAGMGFGILPHFMIRSTSACDRLDLVAPESCPIWLVIHPDLKNNARVRLVVDAIQTAFR